MEKGKISIIMAVYNGKETVSTAIDSILEQTYTNWELVICDDGSTDQTYEILLKYKEKYPDKIKLIRNKINSYLSYSLNRCLEHTTGEYIARMDADDISVKERLEKQISFLKKNPDIDLVGTAMRRFNNRGLADIVYTNQKASINNFKKGVPFFHATIVTYKYVYDNLNGYTVAKHTQRSEDLDLWFRFFYKEFKGANILEPLYLVRENLDAIRRRTIKSRFYAYKTTLIGYKLLSVPWSWYIYSTIELIVKSLIPSKIMLGYRNYQEKQFKKDRR